MKNYARKLESRYSRQPVHDVVFFDDANADDLRKVFHEVGPKAAVWKRPTIAGPWNEWREVGKP